MLRHAASAILLLTVTVVSAGAQRFDALHVGPAAFGAPRAAQDSTSHRAIVYGWRKPALIAGGVVGGLGGLLGVFACEIGETDRNCAVLSEAFFLSTGFAGGLFGAMLGSTSKAPIAASMSERHGDRRRYGALFWGISSLPAYMLAVQAECSEGRERCNENIAVGAVSLAINAGIGYLLGKGIPAYRPITPH